MSWSNPIRLASWADAPDEAGIYEIGFFRGSVFTPLYIGRAKGNTTTIRSRLMSHYREIGNSFIAEYIKNATRDNLYCRTMKTGRAVSKEANLLYTHGCGEGTRYPWNQRIEHQG